MSINVSDALDIAGGVLVAYIVGIVVAMIGVWFLKCMIRWKIFVKAGEAGWKSLIPVYGDIIEYKIVWHFKWYIIQLIISAAISGLVWIPFLGPILFVAGTIVLMVISVVFAMQEAHAFGKDDGFAIGLMIFTFVFQLLLAFDKTITYKGPQPSPKFFGEIMKKEETAGE